MRDYLETLDWDKTAPGPSLPAEIIAQTAGKYREAGPNPESRFGYRFAIEQIGRPHLAVIQYPDDKNRCMAIMDGSSFIR